MLVQQARYLSEGVLMKQINLLPEDIARYSARRRNRPYIIAVCISFAMIGIVWIVVSCCHIAKLSERLEVLQKEVLLAEQRIERYQTLKKNIAMHRNIMQSDSAISDPVQLSSVLALLSRLMPEETFADSLAITTPPVLMMTGKSKSAVSDRLEKRASVEVAVTGLALGGNALRQLIDNLTSTNLLDNVRIIDQKDVYANNEPAQYFHIALNVPLAVSGGLPAIEEEGGG